MALASHFNLLPRRLQASCREADRCVTRLERVQAKAVAFLGFDPTTAAPRQVGEAGGLADAAARLPVA